MQYNNIPVKFSLVWAVNAGPTYLTTPIPTATQTGPNVGRASLNIGFPPVTFVDPGAGGTWPDGRDVQGAFNMCSGSEQWVQAGGTWPYDSSFQSSIGGYPASAIVPSSITQGRSWISTVDNNMSNPDTGGAGWLQWGSYVTSSYMAAGAYEVSVPSYCNEMWSEAWGAGGGASGTINSSGAGGGYAAGFFSVAPGQVINVLVGQGGSGQVYPTAGGNGGLSAISTASAGTLMLANGGYGGGAGPGPGGNGIGGMINLQGQQGTDLDIGGTFLPGQTGFAPGGAAPRGGYGGTINYAGGAGSILPTLGGGGGANYNDPTGQSGADGGVVLIFRIGS